MKIHASLSPNKLLKSLLFLFALTSGSVALAFDFSAFTVKGFEGKGPMEYNSPEDLVITRDGRIIVADHRNNRLQVLTAEGDFIKAIPADPPKIDGKTGKIIFPQPGAAKPATASNTVSAESEAKRLNLEELWKICMKPAGLALDRQGRLYVSSFDADKIGIIDIETGTLTGTISKSGRAQGELNGPMDIDLSLDGRLAVAEFKGKRVQILAEDGKCLKELVYQEETKKGGFIAVAPRAVHWTSEGNLIVAYPTFHQIVCWEPMEGKLIWRYGSAKGKDKGLLDSPSYITNAKDGNILVADTGNHRIVEITRDGKFFEHHSRRGSAPGRLLSPRGLALNSDDTLIIADQGNNRVHFFQPGQATLMIREVKQLALKDDWVNAMPKIEKILYLQPNNPQALDLMINALYFFGNQAFVERDFDKSEEFYRRILRYRPDDPAIPEKLDAIFWAANQSLIATTIFGIIATIVGLILIWVLKILISRFLFNKS